MARQARKRVAARRPAKKKAAARRKSAVRPRRGKAKLRALPWRIAYSLDKNDGLFAQVNARVPGRSRASDGSIGDAAHQSRTSDHNAWRRVGGQPVVGAIDITHDPKGGFDSYAFAQSLAKSRDPRVKYIISNGKIWNHAEGWRKYNGKNPHDHHVHVSASDSVSLFDKRGPFKFDVQFKDDSGTPIVQVPGDRPVQPVPTDPILRRGSKEPVTQTDGPIHKLQAMLGIKVDGDFGPATDKAVRAFQTSRGLGVDGVVGPATWRALRSAKVVAPKLPAASPPATSLQAIKEYVFQDEGDELTVHSDEPGGASRLGISIDTLSAHLGRRATIGDLKNMPDEEAWSIYDEKFWDRIGADKLPAGLNYAAFDFAVNSGPAIVDGDNDNNPKIIEDFLVTALRETTVQKQIDKLCELRLKYMQTNPVKWARYRRGWTARVDRVRARAQQMAA